MFDEVPDATGWQSAADLAAADPGRLGDDDLIEMITGWDRLACWAQAAQARAIAVFAQRRPPVDRQDRGKAVSEFAADELAVALRLSRTAAAARLHTALDLTGRLPGTLQAWSTGAIDAVKARSIADAVGPLTDDQAATVEARVLAGAGRQTPGQLRAALARAVIAADPHGAQHRHQQAHADRRVLLTPAGDGMTELWALLPAPGATALYRRLSTIARAGRDAADAGGEGRSMDARRADALTALAHAHLTGHPPPPALIHITVAATTLLGADDQPAHLTGHGPITAPEARRIAADGRWRRLLTDPATGALLDHGRRSYPPPAHLADHVRTRDQTCRFPTCRHPAATADLDHTTRYPTGPTTESNLAALCRHHHRLKHHTTWTLTQEPGAVLTWTTPTGRQHITTPPALGTTDTENAYADQAETTDQTETTDETRTIAGTAETAVDAGIATRTTEGGDDP